MCGICGKLDFYGKETREDLLEKMTGSLAYRGPNDEGIYMSLPIGRSNVPFSF